MSRTGVMRLAFGCGSLGSELGYRQSCRLLERAYEAGFRQFDVAPPYGHGQAERIVGDVLGPVRPELILVSKAGIAHPKAAGLLSLARRVAQPIKRLLPGLWQRAARGARNAASAQGCFDADAIHRSVAESLRRLRTERLDVLLLHEVLPEQIDDALLAALRDCKNQGAAAAIGIGTGLPASRAILRRHSEFRWVQTAHFDGAFDPELRREDVNLCTHGVVRQGLALLDAQAFAEGPWRMATPALRRALRGPDPERASLLLGAALLQNPRASVVVSTLKVERLPTLAQAAQPGNHALVAELQGLLAQAAAGRRQAGL